MRKISSIVLVMFVFLALAFSVRLIPLQWSPLPYNIDGLSEVRVAQDIATTGHMDFPPNASYTQSYVSDMPVLGLVLAFFSSSLGTEPISSAQVLTSFIGSIAALILYAIIARWRSSRASVATVLSVALLGSFVFSAGCTWKETLGFLLLLMALYVYPSRDRPSHAYVLLSCLVLLPFTHHHATIIGFVIVTFAILIEYANRSWGSPMTDREFYDGLLLFSIWFIAVFYYYFIKLPYLDYLSPQTDLYLYIAVAFLLLVVCVRMSRRNGALSRLPLALVVPAAGAALMLFNYFDSLFPGTPAPAIAIAVPFLAYLILVVPAWQGAQLALARVGDAKNLVLAMVFGPLSFILFSFLRGLDATSYTIMYRTFDFLMPVFAIFIGLGFAALVKGRGKLGIVAGISLVVVCASTLPVAYDSQELFGVENQTYWFEYDAFEWFSEHDVGSVVSDQRLSETGNRLFDLTAYRGLPYDLREGISLEKGRFFVLEDQWSTKGAQEFPLGVVLVDWSTIDDALGESDVLYVGGPIDNQLHFFTAA